MAGTDALTLAEPVQVSGWQPAPRTANSTLSVQANGLPDVSYPYAAPDLAERNGRLNLVYVHDDPNKAHGQQLEIATSRKSSSWTTPITLTGNTLLDAYPSADFDGDMKVVAAWSQVRSTVNDPTATGPKDVLGDMEIAYAASSSYGAQPWSDPITLTSNSRMDVLPQVRADSDGNVMIMWLRDGDNNFPLYPDDSAPLGSDVYYATWDGSSWSAPALGVSGANTDEAPQFARSGSQAVLAWSHDADGDSTDRTDTAIRTATWNGTNWTAGGALAGDGDGVADLWPRVAYDSAGRAGLVWIKRRVPQSEQLDDVVDRLYFAEYSGGSWSTPAVVVEADSIVEPLLLVGPNDELVVVWQARSATGMDLWYAVYDRATDEWSEPIQHTDSGDLEWSYTGYVDDTGELQIFSLNRQVVTQTVSTGAGLAAQGADAPAFGDSTLGSSTHTLGRDLTVDAFTISDRAAAPGSTVTLTASVRNSGDYTVSPVQIAFHGSGGGYSGQQIGSTQTLPDLRSGETATASVTWTVPTDLWGSVSLEARVDPDKNVNESDEYNNARTLRASLPDLIVDWVQSDWSSAVLTVMAGMRNVGGSRPSRGSLTVRLRTDDPSSGTQLYTDTISSLEPGEITTVTIPLDVPSDHLTGAHTGWVLIDPDDDVTEADETNNAAVTALNVLPDLALTPADVQAGSSLTITVHNSGVVTATDALVEVRDGAASGPLLASDTLAAIPPGGSGMITSTLDAGSYTLFVKADPAGAIAEVDESNNLAVASVCLLTADFNGDDEVTIDEIMQIARRLGTNEGDPLYDAKYDLNGGGIGLMDVQLAAGQWGQTC